MGMFAACVLVMSPRNLFPQVLLTQCLRHLFELFTFRRDVQLRVVVRWTTRLLKTDPRIMVFVLPCMYRLTPDIAVAQGESSIMMGSERLSLRHPVPTK